MTITRVNLPKRNSCRVTVPTSGGYEGEYIPAKRSAKDLSEETEKPGCRKKFAQMFHTKAFHITVLVISSLDGLLVLCILLMEIEVLKQQGGVAHSQLVTSQFYLECISVAIVSLFLIEIVFKFWAFGTKFYREHWLEIVDAVVCVVSFAVDVYNIIRHTQHSKNDHRQKIQHPASTQSNVPVYDATTTMSTTHGIALFQDTIADAAGLLVLFRLWRVLRIVNIWKTMVFYVEHQERHIFKQENRYGLTVIKMVHVVKYITCMNPSIQGYVFS
ncbi:Voltage gated hydrogen channel 1 [Fasciola hepatica]|uniref:Voltage gated hydrogen channel 1 n=1 Tax=Fasciola hepatica TaxID=6192 RepID=A0A4E0R0U8_FASHE|nr:Voltage gated hydrogen channel 1 [Fasciola hepatica]